MGGWVCSELECSHSELVLDICCVGIVSAALGSVTPYVFHVVLEERHGGHVVVRIQQEPTEGLDAQGRASVFVFLLHSS